MCDAIEYSINLENRRKKTNLRENPKVAAPFSQLCVILTVTGLLTATELVLAQLCHSITLLVLVHQNIYNFITVLLAVIASKLARDRSLKNTFGWKRLEVVGSISSLVFLFSLCFATFIEAIQTLFHTDHLDTMHHPDWILMLLAVHTGCWFFIFILIGGYTHLQSTAVRETKKGGGRDFKNVIKQVKVTEIGRDLLGVGFVLVTCCLIKLQILRESYTVYVDPMVSIVYIVCLVVSSVSIARSSSRILLQTIPGNIELGVLQQVLLVKYPDILGVHEVHVWSLTPGNHVVSAHIKYRSRQALKTLSSDVDLFFRDHGFKMVTLQPEFEEQENPTPADIAACYLPCSGENCREKTCCVSPAAS